MLSATYVAIGDAARIIIMTKQMFLKIKCDLMSVLSGPLLCRVAEYNMPWFNPYMTRPLVM